MDAQRVEAWQDGAALASRSWAAGEKVEQE